MPKLSVVIPVYNVEKYLGQCIESILKQSFRDLELILVDDGSRDGSGDICDSYARIDPRVRVIHKVNGGVSAARNTGIDVAIGKYVMFCDSDDYAEPDWCKELVAHIEANPKSWCFCGCNIVDDNSELIGENCVIDESPVRDTFSINNYWRVYKTNYSACLWIRIFDLDIIRANGIRFDEKLSVSEDVLFNLEYGKYCDCFATVNLPLYNHRMYRDETVEHLDKKLMKEQFYLNRRVYGARRGFVPTDHRTEFESEFFYRFINDMKTVAHNCDFDSKTKKQKLREILCSEEFKSALNHADTSQESVKFILLLRFRVVILLLKIL